MSLKGKFLIATPDLNNTEFAKSLIFLCAHDDAGAMGLVINHLNQEFTLASLLQNLKFVLETTEEFDDPIFSGGPVDPQRGFVLHSEILGQAAEFIEIKASIFLSASSDLLTDISLGNGPEEYIIFLGYAGWEAQQLEAEIMASSWLVADLPSSLIFDKQADSKYLSALNHLGIDLAHLSPNSGTS